MSNIPVQRNPSWLGRPLCRRYVFAKFKTLQLPVRDGDAVKHLAWRWALGQFKQNEYEILGAWPACAALAYVARDLHKRGVEYISAIAVEVGADFGSPAPEAAPRPPTERSLDTRGRWAVLELAAVTEKRLHKSLTREIRRRAPFADEVAAATFLGEALEKADRRLYAA